MYYNHGIAVGRLKQKKKEIEGKNVMYKVIVQKLLFNKQLTEEDVTFLKKEGFRL